MEPFDVHNAARRYLLDRWQDLSDAYARLDGGGRSRIGYGYTRKAYKLFPRYNVVDAIRVEVERLDPDNLPPTGELFDRLEDAGKTAQSVFTGPPQRVVERRVIADEREIFCRVVSQWRRDGVPKVEPVGYRRVLTPDESADGWRTLVDKWNVQDGYWYPLLSLAVPDDVVILGGDALIDGPGLAAVRTSAHHLGADRVIELREWGVDYLVDVDLWVPAYSGAEGYFMKQDSDWLIYASHEGTTAVAGRMAEMLSRTWPAFDAARWPGGPQYWKH